MMASGSECESDTELMEASSRGAEGRRRWWSCFRSADSYTVAPGSIAPRDRGHLVYVCMVMAGAGFLFPWSSYVTAIDYFFFLYWKDFHQVSVVIPMTYLVSTWMFTGLNIAIVNTVPLHARIGLGYVLYLLALLAVPLLDVLVHACLLPTHSAFYITVLSVVMVGVGSGMQQSSYYGLAGMLPQRYPQAVMVGESVAAAVVSVNRIITKASTDSERFGAIAFFMVSILFILLCVCCQQFIRVSPFVKYHMNQCKQSPSAEEEREGDGERDEGKGDGKEGIRLRSVNGESKDGESDQVTLLATLSEKTSLPGRFKAGLRVRLGIMAEIWQLLVAVFSIFLVTLLVFPGLVSEVQHCSIGDWAPIILITVFNVTDLAAKCVTLVRVRWSPTALMTVALVRSVLVLPILLLVAPSPSQPIIHPGTLAWAVVFVALLGLTNGYFGALPMILFSGQVENPRHRELAGTIMTLLLLTGLMLGSVLAYALTPLTTLRDFSQCSGNSTALFNSCHANSTSTL